MANRPILMLRALLFAFLSVFAGAVFAGYAQVSPPPGFSSVGGMSQMNVGVAANASVAGQTVVTNASLNIGGRAVTVPASMRMAANAPRIAAGLIFSNPYLRAGAAVAGWLGIAGLVYDEVNKVWKKSFNDYPVSDGYEWFSSLDGLNTTRVWPTAEQACIGYMAIGWPQYQFNKLSPPTAEPGCLRVGSSTPLFYAMRRTSSCLAGWYITPAGCIQTPQPLQVAQQEFENILNPDNQPGWPMPDGVPAELPSPLPVMPPVVNPEPNPAPGTQPRPQPLFVPTGDPVRNPDYDPDAPPSPQNQPWNQPGVRVVPSPTVDDPWRVDLQPVNRPVALPDPMPGPVTEQEPNSGDKPKPEEQPGACDLYPEIIACQKTGELDSVPVSSSTVPLAINRDEGYGPANGSCPSPREFTVMGKTMAFRWDLFCDFANGIRPIIVGMAYLAAVLAFLGLSRKGS